MGLEQQLKQKVEETWKQAVRDLPLTDDVCSMLFNCYQKQQKGETDINCPTNIPTFLHICANDPPCDESKGEQELETNGRKWCKGKKINYKSPEFDAKVQSMLQKYSEKIDKEVNKIPIDGRKKANEIVEEFKQVDSQIISSSFPSNLLQMKKDNDNEIKNQNPTDLSTKLQKKAIKEAEERVKHECAREILLDSSNMLVKMMEPKTNSQLQSESNEQILTEMRSMFETLNKKIEIHQEQNEKNIAEIQDKQYRTLNGITDIKTRQEYIAFRDVWYKSKWAFFKKVLEAPKKVIEIVYIYPMNVALEYWMRPILILLGTLMIIGTVGIILYLLSCIDMVIPNFTSSLFDTCIESWKWGMTKLSYGAYYLRDQFFSEKQVEMMTKVIQTGKNAGDWFVGVFNTIQKIIEALFSLVAFKEKLSKSWF